MLSFGAATINSITDLDPFALPIDLLFPGRTVETLEPHRTALAPHQVDFDGGQLLLGVHSHPIRIGGRTVLIDACVSEHKPRPRRPDWHQRASTGFLERLAGVDLRPEDIDIVMCTHLHTDHVGWNTQLVDGRWVPTFPNARYLIGRTEFAHWQSEEQASPGLHNHGCFSDSVMPIVEAGLAEFVDDGFDIASGLSLIALPGHTPGQLGLCLFHGTRQAIFCADAVHSPVQVFHPDWASRFCSDPAMAIATRQELFERLAGTDDLLRWHGTADRIGPVYQSLLQILLDLRITGQTVVQQGILFYGHKGFPGFSFRQSGRSAGSDIAFAVTKTPACLHEYGEDGVKTSSCLDIHSQKTLLVPTRGPIHA